MTHEKPGRAADPSPDTATPEALHALLLGIQARSESWQPGEWPADLPSLDRWSPAVVAGEITRAVARGERPTDDPEAWAPIHAWRWLAHRHPAEAIAPMLLAAEQPWDQLAYAEFPAVCALVGPSLAPTLDAIVRDHTRVDAARIAAIRGLVQATASSPAARAAAVKGLLAALTAQAERAPESEVGDELVEMLITIAPAEFDAIWAPAPWKGDR